MLRLLVMCLLWVSGAVSDTATSGVDGRSIVQPDAEPALDPDGGETSKPKRWNSQPPCPPFYPNFGKYLPPPSFSRPYGPPTYPRTQTKIVIKPTEMPNPYHSYQSPIYAPIVKQGYQHYEKPIVPPISYQNVHRTAAIHPGVQINSFQPSYQYQLFKPAQPAVSPKPVYSYAPIYKEPIYRPISYPKPVVANPLSYSTFHLKKYHPAPQPVYHKQTVLAAPVLDCEPAVQSPIIVPYPPAPKVVQIPQTYSYPKIVQPIAHQPLYQSAHHPIAYSYGNYGSHVQSLPAPMHYSPTTVSPPAAVGYTGYHVHSAPMNDPCD